LKRDCGVLVSAKKKKTVLGKIKDTEQKEENGL